MITIKLIGGLGNQMFQYAAAKSLAELRGTELHLDLSWFENIGEGVTPREFELGCFEGTERIPHLASPRRGGIASFLDKLKFWDKTKIYNEPHFHFDPKFFELGSEVFLNGYFQSEKYFMSCHSYESENLQFTSNPLNQMNTCCSAETKDPRVRKDDKTERGFSTAVEMTIRKEFTFKNPQEGKNKEMADLIQKTDSVSLHVRRGDYVSDAKTNQFHGICDLDYYRKCIAEIAKENKNPHFFVFSDEIDWVKSNLKIDFPVEYIDWNTGAKSYEDMRLMSQCKHNIIANSSFSWWGAWLNANPNKIVFAPSRWFADDSKDTKDLIPEKWRKV